MYLDDGEMVVLTRDGYRVRNLTDTHVDKPVNQIEWDLATIERGGFSHFMLKEIFEQPESLTNTVRGHLLEDEGSARLRGLNMTDEQLNRVDRVIITACGTSWHAGLIGEYIFEELARIPAKWNTRPSSGTAIRSSTRTPWSSPCPSRARPPTRWRRFGRRAAAAPAPSAW